jgi:cell division protein FtsB
MAEQTPGTDWLKRRASWLFGLVIFGYLLVGSGKLVYENYRVHEDEGRLSTEVEQLRQHNLELESLLAYYRTDSYKEKEARARLNFQKPGEKLVVVPIPEGEDVSSSLAPGPQTEQETPDSNPRQWWKFFFSERS